MMAIVKALRVPVALTVAAGVTVYIFLAAATWVPQSTGTLSEAGLTTLLNDPDVVGAGLVTDVEGRTISGASIVLALHGGNGETLWRLVRPVAQNGTFGFRRRDLPALQNVYPATIAVEAPNHLTASTAVLVRIDRLEQGAVVEAQITPRRIQLHPATLNPWLTFVLLLPAIFGLVSAVTHLAQYSRGRTVTYWFAFGSAILWSAVAAELVLIYVRNGYAQVPLFWPDLVVSSGVVVFAYIGTVIYVAYSVLQRGPGFYFDATDDDKRHIILTLGGRVLMAPYIAMVAWAIFAGTFPTLRNGAAAAFFGFFTGLWIKPVMEALNDIGMRFVSAEQRQKVVDRLVREQAADAPPAPTTSAAVLRPDPSFVSLIAEARKTLLPTKGVVGVDAGLKVASNDVSTVRPALVVYVYEKKPPADVADAIPREFGGVPTDVVALAGRAPAGCDTLFPKLSWRKIHSDNVARLTPGSARPATAKRVGNVVLIVDPDGTLFNPFASNAFIFDVLGCYKAARTVLDDSCDFVAFAIDTESGFLPGNAGVGDYHVPVFSEIEGINYNVLGGPGAYAERDAWSASRLRACAVLSFHPERSFYRYLHELGHYWSAYATLKGAAPHVLQESPDTAQGRYHWGPHFDDARSCMDYDLIELVHEGDNRFRKRRLGHQDQFEYCPLDLYLMGLLPASDVGPIRVLRNLQPTPTAGVITADVQVFSIDDVIASCGARTPAFGAAPTAFRQALVVVSKDATSGDGYAGRVNTWMAAYQTAFRHATGGRATLDTTL